LCTDRSSISASEEAKADEEDDEEDEDDEDGNTVGIRSDR
jgi:hypothetical protein